MSKIMKRVFVCAAFAMACVPVVGLRAQNQKELLPAPLPRQIFTAHKVFVSNAGGDTLGDYSGGPDRAYNQFYGALKGWGRYELVAAPGDAELVFEISFAMPIVGENVSGGNGTTVSSSPVKDPQFRLAIVDLKTQVLLWTFTEHVQPALLQMNRDKNFDHAMAALVNDVRNVAGQPGPAAGGASK
ncbi:MAG: hypothetical protein DMG48_16335 [Acidobacteria bacterium]|nr:MAG: hypothetical protein DMG48_16335 [Acidobacteriota bacterium]